LEFVLIEKPGIGKETKEFGIRENQNILVILNR